MELVLQNGEVGKAVQKVDVLFDMSSLKMLTELGFKPDSGKCPYTGLCFSFKINLTSSNLCPNSIAVLITAQIISVQS